jgi:hypothetical protein
MSPRPLRIALRILFWVVLLDFAAQIPYYVINDYLPHHAAPTVSSIVLLGAVLAWFLVGFFGLRAGRRFGFWVLGSFLAVEGLFYLATVLTGAAAFQLGNPNPIVKVVFIIGYLCGAVSLTTLALLIRERILAQRSLRTS